jgi:hypothetical protein
MKEVRTIPLSPRPIFVGMMLSQPCPQASRVRAFDHLDFRSPPQIDPAAIQQLRDKEKLGASAIARRMGIGRASVYRLLGKVAA